MKDLLTNKTPQEKANIKGVEIAKIKKVARRNIKFDGVNLDIEIVSMKPISGGVEVYVKAWDSQGQIGFGDGTVDTERFIIINPPIMVPDGTKSSIEVNFPEGKRSVTRNNYKEDLEEAILQSLAHSIKVTGLRNPRGKIEEGKIGKTVSTIYPSLDGQVQGSDATWSTVRGETLGDDGADHTSSESGPTAELTGGNYIIRRAFFLFDTSSISTHSISGAIFSVQAESKNTTEDQDADLVSSTPAANDDLVAEDFDQIGSTVFSSFAFSLFQVDAYNNLTLSTAGIANITGSGISKFAVRGSKDTDNVAPTAISFVQFRMSETAGTSQDPKLVITHGALDSRAENFRLYYTISKKEVSEVVTD